jgi:hypothetical protein
MIFQCDFQLKEGRALIDEMSVTDKEGYVYLDTTGADGMAGVMLTAKNARKLATKINQLADKIDGIYLHEEIRGTMYCSSLTMPIKSKNDSIHPE